MNDVALIEQVLDKELRKLCQSFWNRFNTLTEKPEQH